MLMPFHAQEINTDAFSCAGIGKETAKELCRRNARVIMACRNVDKARLAAAEIAEATGVHPVIMQLDLCSFKSVRTFAQQVNEREQRLDVLINNAGLLLPNSAAASTRRRARRAKK